MKILQKSEQSVELTVTPSRGRFPDRMPFHRASALTPTASR